MHINLNLNSDWESYIHDTRSLLLWSIHAATSGHDAVQLTVARYTRAYPTFLTLFAVLYIAVCATVRVHDNIKGLILGSIGSIVLTIGQFVWPAHVLWTQVRPLPWLNTWQSPTKFPCKA